jgi:hypothetical protein
MFGGFYRKTKTREDILHYLLEKDQDGEAPCLKFGNKLVVWPLFFLSWPFLKLYCFTEKHSTVFLYSLALLIILVSTFFHVYPLSIVIYILILYLSFLLAEVYGILGRCRTEPTVMYMIRECIYGNWGCLRERTDSKDFKK